MTGSMDYSRFTALLSTLSAPIRLLPAQQAGSLPAGTVTEQGGALWLRLAQPPITLTCPADTPGGADLLLLAARLAESIPSENGQPDSAFSVYRQILNGSLTGSALRSAAAAQHLPDILPRCVLSLRLQEPYDSGAWDELRELIPTQKRDVLVPLDASEAALVKDLTDEDSAEAVEEITQYAEALQETLLGEAGQALIIGIGERFESIADLTRSMNQAREAIQIGKIFHPEAGVHIYARLQLERLLAQVPPKVSEACQRSVFNEETAKLLDTEMLATLDAFFRKDLNLSDTARQLYIHRNTLVYRLDKVQRQTGLDLRSFDDAVTFKVLLALRQYTEATRKG